MTADPDRDSLTILLRRARDGDAPAQDQLYGEVFAHLHALAEGLMRAERSDHTLQPTALVSEAWLRLGAADVDWQDRAHFFRVASRAMRRALVDHARARRSAKRDHGGERVPLDAVVEAWDTRDFDLLDLDTALDALAREEKTLGQIVELRFFGGLTLQETGDLVGMSLQQVHRAWTFARSWLHDRMASATDTQELA